MTLTITVDISPLSNPSVGIGRSVAGLMSELPDVASSAGINVQPYFRKALGSLDLYGLGDMPLIRLRAPMAAEAWVRRLGLIELLTRAPLFHATDFYLPLKNKTPAISTVYDVIYATQSEGMGDQARIKKAMESFVSQCVRVISCSDYSAKAFCELYGYPMERVVVIGLGVDKKYEPPVSPILPPNAKPYFLAVSCNTTRKNTPRLIQAFLRYAQSGGAFDLTLAWTLPDDLRALVEQAGLAHRVHALGKVSEDRLIDLYQHTVCVMFPSLYEGFGFPVLEALACGVPVMTTRRSSLPEVGGDIPVYVDGEDVDEMAQLMWAFERGDMAGVTSRTRFEGPRRAAHFTWRRCAEQTVETYLSAFAELKAKPWKPLQLERAA
jgi:glycosyltransferase involved in cell wall biosynthesis